MDADAESIEPADLATQLADARAVLVDVREPDAFAAGHPRGAVNVPIGQLADRLDELEAGDRVIVTSCGGGTRGPKAAAALRELGIESRALRGGLRGWRAAGLPVVGD